MEMQRNGRRSPVPGGRPLSVVVWLSETEKAQITGMARYEGMAVSAWLGEAGVRAATRADTAAPDPALRRGELMDVHVGLVALRIELSRVGGNLTQVARYAHTTGVLPVAAPRVVARVERTVLQVEDALFEFRRFVALARLPHGGAPGAGG